jgi:hypothetical protein
VSEIESLLKNYERYVRLPWDRSLAPPQRVWLAVYDQAQERRLRPRIPDFETATRNAGHGWSQLDLTDAFPTWMAGHDYRDAYFEQPEDMDPALVDFADAAAERARQALTAPHVDDNTVVALIGLGSLFGLTRASDLIAEVAPLVRGRLLGFFPGSYFGSNYRLLDARDGWNYLAVPITAASGDQ